MKCMKLILFVCAVIGLSPVFAGTYLNCYFNNFDTSNLDYVSVYINDDLVSYSTSEFKDLMGKEDRPLSGSGYLSDAYVYPIENRDASIFIDMCKLYSKSKKARLSAIKVYGVTSKDGFPLIFKGIDDKYHRMEVPSSKENCSLRRYVFEKIDQKSQDQTIDLTQTIIGPISLEQSFFAPSAIDSAKKYFNISEKLIVEKALDGASFLKNYIDGIQFNKQDDIVNGISNAMWYITLKGGFYDGFFHDGAFLIDGDLKDDLFSLLKENGHNRPSTHLHKLSNTKLHYEVPFSVGESAGALPGEKRTLLFFKVDQQGFNHLYIKPEDYSLETIYDVIGHSLQTVSSVLRKLLPAHQLTTQLVGNDNALQNRKERVDVNTSFYRNYIEFLKITDNSVNYIENYRNNGISSIYSHLNDYIKKNNNSEPTRLARKILKDLTDRYGQNLKYRIANEVHVHLDKASLEKDIVKFKKELKVISEINISDFEIIN